MKKLICKSVNASSNSVFGLLSWFRVCFFLKRSLKRVRAREKNIGNIFNAFVVPLIRGRHPEVNEVHWCKKCTGIFLLKIMIFFARFFKVRPSSTPNISDELPHDRQLVKFFLRDIGSEGTFDCKKYLQRVTIVSEDQLQHLFSFFSHGIVINSSK